MSVKLILRDAGCEVWSWSEVRRWGVWKQVTSPRITAVSLSATFIFIGSIKKWRCGRPSGSANTGKEQRICSEHNMMIWSWADSWKCIDLSERLYSNSSVKWKMCAHRRDLCHCELLGLWRQLIWGFVKWKERQWQAGAVKWLLWLRANWLTHSLSNKIQPGRTEIQEKQRQSPTLSGKIPKRRQV